MSDVPTSDEAEAARVLEPHPFLPNNAFLTEDPAEATEEAVDTLREAHESRDD